MKKLCTILSLVLLLVSIVIGTPENTSASGYQIMSDSALKSRFKVIDGDKLVNNGVVSKNQTTQMTKEELSKRYNLKPISPDSIPKGATVINFKNASSLEKFINKVKNPTAIPIQNNITNQTVSSNGEVSAMGYTRQVRSVWWGFSKINLYADIYWNSYKRITYCHAWTTHTGVTFSLGWEQKYAYCYPSSGYNYTMVRGGGTGKYLIFYQGIGYVYSVDINIHYKYVVP